MQRRLGKFFISQVAELAKPEGSPSVCISPQMWIAESDSVLVRKVRRITHGDINSQLSDAPLPLGLGPGSSKAKPVEVALIMW